jgi:hypothetical protein
MFANMRLYPSFFVVGNCPEELVDLVGVANRAAIVVNALDNRPDERTALSTNRRESLSASAFMSPSLIRGTILECGIS